jgi:hypothetical protein
MTRMSKEIKNQLESVILELANSFTNESATRNAALIDSLHHHFNENEELYESEITLTYLNFVEFAATPWFTKNEVKDEKNKYIINYIYNGIFTHFVRKTIEKNEGTTCSGDKEHFVIKKVKEAIITGENQSLYATYEGCERIDKEKWHEQAYWSPKSFRDTNEVIKKFWKWYRVEE